MTEITTWFNNIQNERMRKAFSAAYGAAMCSPGIGYGKFKVGAVLTDTRGRIKSVGFNQYKTHPKLAEYSDHPFLHAETHAMLNYGLDNCDGLHIYVVRIRKKGDIGLAKPCEVCQMIMKDHQVYRVFYSTGDKHLFKELII